MTTTLTSPADTSPGLAEPALPAKGRGVRQRARRMWLRVVVMCLALAVAGVAVRWVWQKIGFGRELAEADKVVIVPRTFNVVLKEKGELKAARSTDIICEVEGRSTIISLIPEGAAVKKGDLLVELASDQIEERIRQEELKEANALTAFEAAKTELEIQRDKNASDIRKAQLAIELKQLELEKYEKGDWAQRLRDAEIAIEQAEMTLKREKQDYEAAKQLLARRFITQTDFQQDEFNFRKAAWDLEKARNAKKVLEQYTHVAELRRRESDLEEAKKEFERVKKNADAEEIKKLRAMEGKQKELELIQDQLAKLRVQKKKCRITAPTQGFVVYHTPGGRFWSMDGSGQIKEGATVHERQVLLSLPDTSQMQVVVRVHEAKTDRLAVGQRATVTVEALPGQQFSGTVTKIAPLADTQNRWLNPDLKEYETEITLDPTDQPLKPSVTAYVEILVETVDNKLAVPVQAVYTKGSQRYVFCDNGGGVDYAAVELGAVGTVWAEVIDGLTRGDQVLLAFSDEHRRLIPDPMPGEPGFGGPRSGWAGKDSVRPKSLSQNVNEPRASARPALRKPATGTGSKPDTHHADTVSQRRRPDRQHKKGGKTRRESPSHSAVGTR